MAWTTPETYEYGQVLTADSMNAMSQNVVALQGARRIAYVTTASSYTVNQTAIGSASNVFTTSATVTPTSGTQLYRVEFYCPRLQIPAGTASACQIRLYNSGGSVDLGTIAEMKNNGTVTTIQSPVMAVVPLSAASETVLNIRAVYVTTTGPVLGAGSAGSAQLHNMSLSVFGPFEAI